MTGTGHCQGAHMGAHAPGVGPKAFLHVPGLSCVSRLALNAEDLDRGLDGTGPSKDQLNSQFLVL